MAEMDATAPGASRRVIPAATVLLVGEAGETMSIPASSETLESLEARLASDNR